MVSIFSCVCWPSVCLLWEYSYLGPLPIFQLDYIGGFLVLSCVSSLYILDTNPLLDMLLANDISGLVLKIYKEVIKLNTPKPNNPLKMGKKTWTDTSPKKTSRWPTDTWKDAQHHSASGKCKSKYNEIWPHTCQNG